MIAAGIPPELADRPYDRFSCFSEIKIHLAAAREHLTTTGQLLFYAYFHEREHIYDVCRDHGVSREEIAMSLWCARRASGDREIRNPKSEIRNKSFSTIPNPDQFKLLLDSGFDESADPAAYKTLGELTNTLRETSRQRTLAEAKAAVAENRCAAAERRASNLESRLAELEALRDQGWIPESPSELQFAAALDDIAYRVSLAAAQLKSLALPSALNSEIRNLKSEIRNPKFSGWLLTRLESLNYRIRSAGRWGESRLGHANPADAAALESSADETQIVYAPPSVILNEVKNPEVKNPKSKIRNPK